MRLTEQGPILRITQYNVFEYIVGAAIIWFGGYMLYMQQGTVESLAAIGLGLLLVLLLPQSIVQVDQSTRTVYITKRRIIGQKTTFFSFSEVHSIELQLKAGKKNTQYPLCLLHNDGTTHLLAKEMTKARTLSSDSTMNERHIGTRIAEIIGVPFSVRETNTLKETWKSTDTNL